MKPIVKIPHPVLYTPAKTVMSFDKKLMTMIADMKQSLLNARNPKGVGLAAPQIGLPWRIFITRPTEKSAIRVFINPEILSASPIPKTTHEKDHKLEGCLSVPKIWGHVRRSDTLTLRYQDEKGELHEEEFSGFMATIIQHETDHTNGTLFTMRIIEQKGKFYQIAMDEEGKEVLDEIELR